MSKNAFIDLIARLNKKDSKDQIKTNLGEIASELNKLKDNGLNIQCHIDTSSEAVNKLQGELNTLANKLKLNIGVDAKSIASTATSKTQSNNSATTTTVKIDKMSVESQINELSKLLQSKLHGEANAVMRELVSSLQNSLGESTEIWTTWEKAADGALTNFSVSAKKATGDLEKFNFVVNKTGKVELFSSTGSDKGILQKQKETLKFIDEYTSKINSLRSPSTQNFTASYNDQIVTFESLSKDLENLRKGEGSIEEVRGKFVALQGAISSVKDIIKESQGKSLDPFTNAKISAKEFDNTLKSIGVDLSNLKGFNYTGTTEGIPKVYELNKEYKSLKTTIADLNSVEESQRSNQWYMDYADASERVRQLQSDIKLLNKLKREDTSSGTKKQLEEFAIIKNGYRELQKLEKERYSYKTGSKESAYIGQLSGGLTTSINAAKKRLENEGLLTSELKKQIQVEEKAYNQAVKRLQLRQQDRETIKENARIEKEQNDNRSRYMSEITNAYSRMNAEYSKLNNPKLSQEERDLAQQRINWNEKIIEHNKELLNTENLLTQKNDEKLKQLEAINEQKQKEAQAGANRVTQSQAETERLRQEKKEAKDLATTVTQIVNGYEKLATLYSGKTAPTNGTTKGNINKAESARQHSELQAQLSELEAIAQTNDRITNQQREQINNAKTQYDESVIRTDMYNRLIINEQNATKAEQESIKNAKERNRIVNDYITQIEEAYKKMGKFGGTINKHNVGEYSSSNARNEYQKQSDIVEEKRKELNIYLSSLSVGNKLTEQEQRRLDNAKERLITEEKAQGTSAADARVAEQKTKEVKAQQETYNQIVSTLNKYKNSLGGFNNSNIIKQNGTNGDVMKQLSANKSLLQQIESISALLSNGKNSSAANIAQAKQELDKLIPSLETAKKDSDNLNQSLKDNKITRQVTNKFNTLKNQIETFASVNKKATESTLKMSNGQTFKDNWETIVRTLYSGKLQGNAAEIEKLAIAFKDLNGQARSAGLVTNRFLVDMQSQLKMVLNRYISLYAVIGYIRKMVDAVKELDNAMINLRRVTDETKGGYVAFLEKANKQAQELRITTSELVEQTYQWSKLGYDLEDALTLSKASTIFAKVADTTQEQSLKNLITIMKAYGIEAKNVMDIVDKLDNLNNRYAVSAEGLGEGLERSASALAMTGNSLEQSIAMLTGAGEITQNLENTGNAIKILALRLQNMKGALEELDEPVDDLMEVSKVQTQILNLTHNQVDIFDSKTGEFRSTYDILKDISKIWDSLNSTNRASLTEILFGKNRANIGLALISAFQSGQVENAYNDALKSANVATEEYEKMMAGIESHTNALKGALQELANKIIKSDTINFIINGAKNIVTFLTKIIDLTGSLGLAIAPIMALMSATNGTGMFKTLASIASAFKITRVEAEGAANATIRFGTALKVLSSFALGAVIGVIVSLLSKLVDKLITTDSELKEIAQTSHDALVDLKNNADELEKSNDKLDSVAEEYSKIATTIGDVNERKTKLTEIQQDLVNIYGEEANGIDLVNGKYSEQLKKLEEIRKEEEEKFKRENASNIAEAKSLSKMRLDESNLALKSTPRNQSEVQWSYGVQEATNAQFKVGNDFAITSKKDYEALSKIADKIEGIYKGTSQSIYLTGDLEEARDKLSLFVEEYSKLENVNQTILQEYTSHLKMLNEEVALMKEMQPYIDKFETPKFNNVSDFSTIIENAFGKVAEFGVNEPMEAFNNKLDEAQEKLKQLANPENLTIDQYEALRIEVQELENELYKMAGNSEDSRKAVKTLFEAFGEGLIEGGDGLDKFVQQFKDDLEGTFKTTAEIVTTTQEAINNLAEGKGLSHTDAWKLLEEDTQGYLQTIKLVNGEYYFSQEELIKFKDEKIKLTQEDLRQSNITAQKEVNNLMITISTQEKKLKLLQEELQTKKKINSQSDADYYNKEIERRKISIEESKKAVEDYLRIMGRNNLLIGELGQNLGAVRIASVGLVTQAENQVAALENEVAAIDDAIDSLNDRKDILESEKQDLQDQLELLNEQKKALEEQQKSLKSIVDKQLKRYQDVLKTQLDAIKDEKELVKDEYDERINALKTENEERDIAYKKEKALIELDKAKSQMVRTYSSARGWEYGANKDNVVQAQKNLDDVLADEKVKKLEKERDDRIKTFEKQEKAYEKQIKAFEDYAKKYEIITEDIEDADAALLAEQLLGADWRVKIEEQDEGLLKSYQREYQNYNNEITRLTNVEIKNTQDSIKAKESEINKIGDEIKAYNNYKQAVQNNLSDAKEALENYQKNVEDATSAINGAIENTENTAHYRLGDMNRWFNESANTAENARNRICNAYNDIGNGAERLAERLRNSSTGYGIINSAGDAALLEKLRQMGYYADGGVNNYTGLAMLHGTAQNPETIFNAKDSAKLYELVHNTPNIMAAMVSQASQLIPNLTNTSNNTANSINVNIGQVVANNPMELTRNLDTHLDSYFRRKLTQGYVQ